MADLAAHIQTPLANFGGRYHQDHKLMYDSANVIRHSDQRASSDTVQPSSHHGGHGNSGPSTTEEVTNEADDEDSSGGQADEQDEEDDNAEVLAPSHGYGKGKGRRPAIRIESAGDDTSHEDDESSSREAGRTSNHLVNQLVNENKKRTYSNVSNTSLLFGEDNTGFPRPKVARTLSPSGGTGLLAYTAANDDDEKAIESDDEKDLDTEAGGEQTTDVDDDEDYSGLNQISDDEDDIEKVELQEESFIINDELNHTPHPDMFWADYSDARRLSLDSFGSDTIFPLPPDDDPCHWEEPRVGSFLDREDLPPSPNPVSKRKLSEGSSKRVRFDDEVNMSDSSTSSSSDEMDSALYPDLFLESDKLPPIVHQLMEMDNQSDDGYPSNASDQSFWDYVEMESRNATPHVSDMSDESSSEAGSSGYETDLGDTTDEWESDFEGPSVLQTPKPKSVLHRPSSAPASRAATPKPFQRASAGPPRGVFYHNDDQPIAITDRKTKALTFYRPKATNTLGPSPFNNPMHFATYSSSTSTANNSPRASIQQLNTLDTDADDVFSTTADIMLSGMLGSNPVIWPHGGGTVGPAEAFYPMVYVNANGEFVGDDDSFDDDEDIDDDVNLTEFMDFGSDADDTDVDQGNQTDVPATPATSTIAFPGSASRETPTPRTSLVYKHNNANAILEHLDRAGVTAFRNNQNRFRDIACLPHDPNLRASVSRPIRSGRSADTLISPLRKRSSISKKQARSKASTRLGERSASRMATFS